MHSKILVAGPSPWSLRLSSVLVDASILVWALLMMRRISLFISLSLSPYYHCISVNFSLFHAGWLSIVSEWLGSSEGEGDLRLATIRTRTLQIEVSPYSLTFICDFWPNKNHGKTEEKTVVVRRSSHSNSSTVSCRSFHLANNAKGDFLPHKQNKQEIESKRVATATDLGSSVFGTGNRTDCLPVILIIWCIVVLINSLLFQMALPAGLCSGDRPVVSLYARICVGLQTTTESSRSWGIRYDKRIISFRFSQSLKTAK